MRIGYSAYFIRSYFISSHSQAFSFSNSFPKPLVLLVFFASYLATLLSSKYFCEIDPGISYPSLMQELLHVSVGAFCFLITCFTIFKSEISLLRTLRELRRKKKIE